MSRKNTVKPAVKYPKPAVSSNRGTQTSGSKHKVALSFCEDTATMTIKAAKPRELSIKAVKIGTSGSKPRGNTTFFTKFGCPTTDTPDLIKPLVKALQGSKPAHSHTPNVMSLFSGKPARLSFTLRTIENT